MYLGFRCLWASVRRTGNCWRVNRDMILLCLSFHSLMTIQLSIRVIIFVGSRSNISISVGKVSTSVVAWRFVRIGWAGAQILGYHSARHGMVSHSFLVALPQVCDGALEVGCHHLDMTILLIIIDRPPCTDGMRIVGRRCYTYCIEAKETLDSGPY